MAPRVERESGLTPVNPALHASPLSGAGAGRIGGMTQKVRNLFLSQSP